MGRPRSCVCGVCDRCKHADYMRNWYQQKSEAERKEWTAKRDPLTAVRSDEKRRGTPRRRASLIANSKRMRAKNPAKYKARTAVSNALRDGLLFRKPCVTCGNPKAEAHHNDYSKPLDVIWMCRKHHKAHHAMLTTANVSGTFI